MSVKKAEISDAPAIQKIINYAADKGKLLPRSLIEIYENLRDFWLKEKNGELAGCVALHIVWEDLGEIRSLVVEEKFKNKGIGKELVLTCIEEGKKIGLKKLFALTYVPEFFKKLGFCEISKEKLPHKIWSDCIKCVKFPDCNETALIIDIYE